MLKKKNTEDYILLIFAILGVVIIILTVFNFAFHSHVAYEYVCQAREIKD